MDDAAVRLTDPRALRGYAHPTRMALVALVRRDGPQIATQAARALGESVAGLLSGGTRVRARGEWMLLPFLGLRRPDSCGLGMFRFAGERFGHLGGAAGFFSILMDSTTDGSGVVIMTAANPAPFPFRLLRAIGAEFGWGQIEPRSVRRAV